MKKVFIIGTTEYSFMIHSMIEQEKLYDVLGHAVNEKYVEQNRKICNEKGTCLYALEKLQDIVGDDETVNLVNTIGYSNMNKTREKIFDLCISLGYKFVNYISKKALCLSDITGEGNIVFPGAYIGTNVILGNDNVVYTGSVLTHDISIGNHNFIAANTTVGGGSVYGQQLLCRNGNGYQKQIGNIRFYFSRCRYLLGS